MKELLRMVLVLVVISALAGGILAIVNRVTSEPIAAALREEKLKAMRAVLPDHDNDPITNAKSIVEDGKEWVFYIATKDGVFAGTAFEAASEQGYSGTIRIMAGVNADDTLRAIEILEQSETPGLGARIAENSFRDQFKNRDISSTKWSVRSEGGEIDAITGATISPRAVLDALQSGLNVYSQNKEGIASSYAEPAEPQAED